MKNMTVRSGLAMGAIALLTLSGCTSPDDNDSDISSNDASTLDKVISNGEVRVAVLPDFPPFSVQNAAGDLEGYEVDVAKELAEALDVELTLVAVDGPNRLSELDADRVDVNISAWTATNDRAKAVGYTIPYVTTGVVPLFRTDDPLSSYDDLANADVTVQRGSIGDSYMAENYPDVDITRSTTLADCVEAVRAEKTDTCLEGIPGMVEAAGHDPELEVLDETPPNPQLISMGVHQGDQVWINYLDNFIRNLTVSGTNAELYEEWLGSEMSPVLPYQ